VGTADSRTAVAKSDDTSTRTDATEALTCMGYKPREARAAIDSACNELGDDLPLEKLVFEALRRCRRTSQPPS
jgi:Holliday junction resolvasome RuvABC DNA-binding subunit